MNMQENYRLIEALESAGWTAQEIVNLIKYVDSWGRAVQAHQKGITCTRSRGYSPAFCFVSLIFSRQGAKKAGSPPPFRRVQLQDRLS